MDAGARGSRQPWTAGAQRGDGALWAQPGPAPVPTQLQPGALGSPRSRSRGFPHGIGAFPGAWAHEKPKLVAPGHPNPPCPGAPGLCHE